MPSTTTKRTVSALKIIFAKLGLSVLELMAVFVLETAKTSRWP